VSTDPRVLTLLARLDNDDRDAERVIALAFAPGHDRTTCEVCVPWEAELARLHALDRAVGDVPRPRVASEVQAFLDSKQATAFLGRQRWSADALHREALVDLGVIDVSDSSSARLDLWYELDSAGRKTGD
jgi:hypothetical protein